VREFRAFPQYRRGHISTRGARVDLVRRLHRARIVTLVDVAIILGGIILAAWLVDGHTS